MAAKKSRKGKWYAWSDIHNGGKTQEVRGRTIVVERNMVARGETCDQASIGVSDEDWDALIEGGSVRPYPLPDGLGDNESPSSYVLRSLLAGKEQLDPDLLLQMSLSQDLAGAQSEEEAPSELAEA
jgi:hypothetical protein